MILGLDVSTTIIGYCLLNAEDGSVCLIGHLDLKKYSTLYEKVEAFMHFLFQLIVDHKVQIIFVEQPAKVYSMSSAHVISLLQRFNGMVCAIAHMFVKNPELLDVREARKLCGIKVPKGVKKKEAKKYIVGEIRKRNVVKDDIWQLNKNANLKDFCFDMADAYVIARAGFLRKGLTPPLP